MANFYADVLKVKSVFVLDDSGAYGVGMADAFEKQAGKKGIKVLGRDRLDPKAADYTAILTKIKSLNPDALYYGGVGQAGVKLAKQAYDIVPKMIKGGGDGVVGPVMLTAVGYPGQRGLVRHHRLAARRGATRRRSSSSTRISSKYNQRRRRLRHHRLRRGAGDHRRDQARGGERQAGDARGGARRDRRPPRCRPFRASCRSTRTAT